jgi:oligopeptide/dipeptide ABC transporter ATP-binding protein
MSLEPSPHSPLLKVNDLRIQFKLSGNETLKAVDGIDFHVGDGEIVGLVGESGSGKTVFSSSLLRLIPANGQVVSGTVCLEGVDILQLGPTAVRALRGTKVAMIFQNALSALNPVYTIGAQMQDVIMLHQKVTRQEARLEALRLMQLVRIPDPERRLKDYPHQLSLGTCQRIMIAMALSCKPRLLIADEPTASLDVTIQADIMDLLLEIRSRLNMAILLVSHDLGVIARMCDRIAVMYLGKIVEVADAKELFQNPRHPYTQALLSAVPLPDPSVKPEVKRLSGEIPSPMDIPVGCRFRLRCPQAFDLCSQREPNLLASTRVVGDSEHQIACWLEQPQLN